MTITSIKNFVAGEETLSMNAGGSMVIVCRANVMVGMIATGDLLDPGPDPDLSPGTAEKVYGDAVDIVITVTCPSPGPGPGPGHDQEKETVIDAVVVTWRPVLENDLPSM